MITENQYVGLFTDGSCLENGKSDARGGIGFIITYGKDSELEFSQGYINTTNNRMELLAVIEGINKIIEKIQDSTIEYPVGIIIHTDSKYTADAVNQNWLGKWAKNNWMTASRTKVKNQDLWNKFNHLKNDILKEMNISITIKHIEGHSGHLHNERCDRLARQASAGDNHIPDEKYM